MYRLQPPRYVRSDHVLIGIIVSGCMNVLWYSHFDCQLPARGSAHIERDGQQPHLKPVLLGRFV
jgi:hypothetical protein